MKNDPPPGPDALSRKQLLEIIYTCERRFADYVGYHLVKDPPDYEKAESNLESARICSRDSPMRRGVWRDRGYGNLSRDEVQVAAVGDGTIILAHPSSEPVLHRNGVWSTLTIHEVMPIARAIDDPSPSSFMPAAEAKDELLRILAEAHMRTLTPRTDPQRRIADLLVHAGLWQPQPG